MILSPFKWLPRADLGFREHCNAISNAISELKTSLKTR